MLDCIQFTNWMNKNNSQWHCPHTCAHEVYGCVISQRSIGTSALCNVQTGYKWDVEPTSGWNDFPCEIGTKCMTHSDSSCYWDKMLLLVKPCPEGAAWTYMAYQYVILFLQWYPPFYLAFTSCTPRPQSTKNSMLLLLFFQATVEAEPWFDPAH